MTDEFKGVTVEQLKACMPYASQANIDRFHGPLNLAMSRYQINTPRRQAAFLAQIAHESGSLKYTREISSGVQYEGREDLGNTQPGDGPRFRGRGLLQITGRYNYEEVSKALNYGFINSPEKLELPGAASLSAAWFWYEKGLNRLADIDAFEKISARINGINKITGKPNGMDDRIEHWERCKKALKVTS